MNIITPLAFIINLIFSTSIVPKKWKIATVTPVYKGGELASPTNYRPISVINNFSKIFEKCLKNRIVDFLEKNKLFSPNQFGFKKDKGTEDAVFELIREIHNNWHKLFS